MKPRLLQTQSPSTAQRNPKSDGLNSPDQPLAGISLVFFALLAIAIVIIKKSKRAWKRERLERPPAIPCVHCRYFTSSAYLRCAVHPVAATTQAAINCADYQSKDGETIFQSLKR